MLILLSQAIFKASLGEVVENMRISLRFINASSAIIFSSLSSTKRILIGVILILAWLNCLSSASTKILSALKFRSFVKYIQPHLYLWPLQAFEAFLHLRAF